LRTVERAGVPTLGDRLDASTVAFALAVIAVVFLGRHMPLGRPADAPAPRA